MQTANGTPIWGGLRPEFPREPWLFSIQCSGCQHIYAATTVERARAMYAAHYRRHDHKLFSDHVHWLYDAKRKLREAREDALVEALLDPERWPKPNADGVITYEITDTAEPFDQLPRGCHK